MVERLSRRSLKLRVPRLLGSEIAKGNLYGGCICKHGIIATANANNRMSRLRILVPVKRVVDYAVSLSSDILYRFSLDKPVEVFCVHTKAA